MKAAAARAKPKAAGTVDPQERLRAVGLRRTPVRVAVLQILDAAESPLDAPTIVARVSQPNDAVTVYRTLNTFTEKKLVHRMTSDNGWRYAIGRADAEPMHHHPHFICDDCGEVECVKESANPPTLLQSLRLNPKYSADYAEITVHGTCEKCRHPVRR